MSSIVAYRYAKALVDLASEQNVLDAVNEDMGLFEKVCLENDEFSAIMASPIVRHEKKKTILNKLFDGKVNKVSSSIFTILTNKNREKLLLPISREFRKIYNEKLGIQKVVVVSSTELTEIQKTEIVANVSSSLQGKKIELEEKVDESLIGGYILRIGDTQIDTSVKKRLNELRVALAQ
ncbi:MAG: ATP synthase F1 subunit delta [Leadbetterella sp.]